MLHLLSASDALRHGAACLDGSQPGIWYDAPSVPKSFKGTRKPVADAGGNRSWLIMLDGGAWCYSAAECLERASSVMGSSKSFSRHFWPHSGPMSANFAINPAFAGFHRVLFGYCDGSSFLGDSTVDVAGTSKGQQPRRAFLRGRRNVEALLHMLVKMGMGDAEVSTCAGYEGVESIEAQFVHRRRSAVEATAPCRGHHFFEWSSLSGSAAWRRFSWRCWGTPCRRALFFASHAACIRV
eukprot:5962916-Pleurochrysis_carterae.AAC.3